MNWSEIFYLSATIALWLIVLSLISITVIFFKLATNLQKRLNRFENSLVVGVLSSIVALFNKRTKGGD